MWLTGLLSVLGGLKPIHLVIGAAVLLLVSLGIQTWRVDNLKKELQQTGAKLQLCAASVQLQNDSIEQLRVEGELRAEAGQRALDLAQSESKRNAQLVGKILSAKPGENKCASADDLILSVAGGVDVAPTPR